MFLQEALKIQFYLLFSSVLTHQDSQTMLQFTRLNIEWNIRISLIFNKSKTGEQSKVNRQSNEGRAFFFRLWYLFKGTIFPRFLWTDCFGSTTLNLFLVSFLCVGVISRIRFELGNYFSILFYFPFIFFQSFFFFSYFQLTILFFSFFWWETFFHKSHTPTYFHSLDSQLFHPFFGNTWTEYLENFERQNTQNNGDSQNYQIFLRLLRRNAERKNPRLHVLTGATLTCF